MLACLLLATDGRAWAQAPSVQAAERITAAQLQEDMKSLEGLESVSAEARAKALDVYKQALEELRIADDWLAKAAGYQLSRQNAPKDLEEVRGQLGRAPPESVADASPQATLDDLKQRLAQVEAGRAAAQAELASLETRCRRRIDRVDEVRVLDAAAKGRLEEVEQQLAAQPAAAEPLARATRALWLARRMKILAERTAYEEELPSYEATRELLRARLDLATRQVNLAEKQEKEWKELVAERVRQDAQRKARDARWAVTTARPEVLPLAKENERLAQLRSADNGPAQRTKSAEREVAALNSERARLQTQFAHVRKVVELTDAVGLLLQRQREELPDLHYHRSRIRARRAEVAGVKLQLIDLEARRSELADIEPQVERLARAIQPPPADAERAEIEAAVRQLLSTQREYLDALITDYNKYFNTLVLDLDKSQQELIEETRQFAAFIDERILWIRSSTTIGRSDLSEAAAALAWLTATGNWAAVGRTLVHDAAACPLLYLVAAGAAGGLMVSRRRMRRRIHRLGRHTATQDTSLRPTVDALGLSLLMAVQWPGVLGFVAWRLAASWDDSAAVKATAFALEVAALMALVTELFRQVCRKNGVAAAHFCWPHQRLKRLRENLLLLQAAAGPLTFVAAALYEQENAAYSASLGRLCFIATATVLSTCAWRALRPLDGLDGEHAYAKARPSWQHTGRRLGYRLGVTVPLGLAVLAALGYYYTALQLAWRLQITLWLLLSLVITASLMLRWLQVARGRLALAQQTASPARHAADAPGDLAVMDAQTRRLLGSAFVLALMVGAWLIWIDVLPALKFLDQWKLWSAADASTPVAGQVLEATAAWITLGDLVLALGILLMTAIASRNLPGLLEIAWLQWLPVDAGGRYAAVAISRYGILLLGIVPALRVLGIGWANVQWLAAAMTVGLGFGLQEIFANFVSGLIILFERPVRVGDLVTVGGLTGTVSRIRSRATTITDGDNRELIVPNKEFITGQLVNWTLSDRVLRLVVRVSIALESDTVLAARLLLETARAHPLVLKQPAPAAVFTGFGNGSLDFELCVFVAGPEHLARLRHELNTSINAAFRRSGIEMALPREAPPPKQRPTLPLIPSAAVPEECHEQRQSA